MAADVEKIYKSPEGVVSKYRPRFVGDVHLPDDTYLKEHGWEIKEKSTWGGSRGGGRPKNDRSITLSVRITQEAMDKLNTLTKNKSEFIDNLIMKQ